MGRDEKSLKNTGLNNVCLHLLFHTFTFMKMYILVIDSDFDATIGQFVVSYQNISNCYFTTNSFASITDIVLRD